MSSHRQRSSGDSREKESKKSSHRKRDRRHDDYSDEETREEREKRKEAKKVAKVAKMLGYSNDVNPFGDSNLLQPFIWGKKKEKEKHTSERSSKKSSKDGITVEQQDRLELMSEIEKVRKRRADREAELAEMERLRDEEQRLREAADYHDWQQKEEKFVLEQTRKRSRIRLLEQREKPVDVIAKNILLVEAAEKQLMRKQSKKGASRSVDIRDEADEVDLLDLEGEMRNPVDMMQQLEEEELQELRDGVQDYIEWERNRLDSSDQQSSHLPFWEAMASVVKAELKKIRSRNRTAASSDESSSLQMHDSIAADVAELLNGKSTTELDDLQHDIEKNLRDGRSSGGDIEYWELLRDEVALQRARSFVHDQHVHLLRQQLELLTELKKFEPADSVRDSKTHRMRAKDEILAAGDEIDVEKAFADAERDEKMEEQDEVLLPGSTYWWQDKYRPRKPRYFNHVKTGWDRTKYNLTHYDNDNPPPKMIKGYKFTIFYPDLIDKTKTPKYFLEPCTDGDDFAIIRFHAGPPYEDIAFKIINKEWDTHRRSGFYSVFERGVLRLNFNFVRRFYRR